LRFFRLKLNLGNNKIIEQHILDTNAGKQLS